MISSSSVFDVELLIALHARLISVAIKCSTQSEKKIMCYFFKPPASKGVAYITKLTLVAK